LKVNPDKLLRSNREKHKVVPMKYRPIKETRWGSRYRK